MQQSSAKGKGDDEENGKEGDAKNETDLQSSNPF